MIFLGVRADGSETEPMGFNCGPSSLARAQMIAADLRATMRGVRVYGPEMRGDDFIVTVSCPSDSLPGVTRLVETTVAIMHRRGQLS